MSGKFDASGLLKMQKDIEQLAKKSPAAVEKTTKELSARLLALVIGRTKPGEKPDFNTEAYADLTEEQKKKAEEIWNGYSGGTLRRGWTVKAPYYLGQTYICEVINPVEYAPYVEYGHRQQRGRYVPALGKSLSKSWVKGRFMLTTSLKKLEKITPKIIEQNLNELLKGAFTGGK